MSKAQGSSVNTFVNWGAGESVEVRPANVFAMTRSAMNEVVFVIGHVFPPILVGPDAKQRAEQLAKTGMDANILGRYVLTTEAARQLLQVLQEHLKRDVSA